jgi:hypothetical protein
MDDSGQFLELLSDESISNLVTRWTLVKNADRYLMCLNENLQMSCFMGLVRENGIVVYWICFSWTHLTCCVDESGLSQLRFSFCVIPSRLPHWQARERRTKLGKDRKRKRTIKMAMCRLIINKGRNEGHCEKRKTFDKKNTSLEKRLVIHRYSN